MAIFTRRSLAGEPLRIYGDGTQTRDLLYVTDCARFVVDALLSDAVVGQVLNAGTGVDVSVNDLAAAIEPDPTRIEHVEHIHPQSEIAVLRCDPRRARELLGWTPAVGLEEGLAAGADMDGRPDGARDRARLMPAAGAPGDRRRRAGPDDAAAVRPPGHRRARHRGGHGRPALRLADDRTARPAVRGRPGRGDRRPARRRVQLGDRGAPRAAAVAGLGPGDEAITTPMTFVASANASCTRAPRRGSPMSRPGSLLIDPGAVAAAVTDRTRAIIPVDYAGQPADYTALRAIADAAPGGPLDDHRGRVALARARRSSAGRSGRWPT